MKIVNKNPNTEHTLEITLSRETWSKLHSLQHMMFRQGELEDFFVQIAKHVPVNHLIVPYMISDEELDFDGV